MLSLLTILFSLTGAIGGSAVLFADGLPHLQVKQFPQRKNDKQTEQFWSGNHSCHAVDLDAEPVQLNLLQATTDMRTTAYVIM